MKWAKFKRYRGFYTGNDFSVQHVHVLGACWSQAMQQAQAEARRRAGAGVTIERLEELTENRR
ncbi:hypothetical protein [Salinicola rhizosphaerae]|uniref:Uncharacterized protein n=1 Tax=Salinicola rhizosphaerae TaxID=1443141 RepID=A0ABQ3DWI6_9GAMM|nr:hypothetical protein [Salinicola rhizosphaerae]GHB16078.1 hypothetical protein GCM10009038_13120 [Salinicola rhizosphaerae]